MMNSKAAQWFGLVVGLFVSASLLAAEPEHSKMDHGGHMAKPATGKYADTKKDGRLKPLSAIPESGKAREAGFDDRYTMEPTTAAANLATLCAQGTRGLVMLDNAIWKQCGDKPKGASKGPGFYPAVPPWNKAGTGESPKPMDHSKMAH